MSAHRPVVPRCPKAWRRPPRRPPASVGEQRGSVLPLVALLIVVMGGLALALGRLGGSAVERAQARTAADAAALAGAAAGRAAAADVAADNGGDVVSYATEGSDVLVEVRVGEASARARARATPRPPFAGVGHVGARGAPGTGARGGLDPRLSAAIAAAEQLLGRAVPVTSGYRSPAMQRHLWDNRSSNPFPVARPGTSAHERGLAIDVPRAFAPTLAAVAPRVGLCQPLPVTDPVHFELCRRTPAA